MTTECQNMGIITIFHLFIYRLLFSLVSYKPGDSKEYSGSVVERLSRDRGVAGWNLTGVTAKTHLSLLSTGSTVEIVSEYDQEIPQSQTADNPVAPRPFNF